MAEKRKALASVSELARAVEREAGEQMALPGFEDIRGRARSQGPISTLLGCGQNSAVPLRYLMSVTGLDGRTVRKAIEAERRRGVPILSDCLRGYYLPAADYEIVTCADSLRHRAREILRTADCIERGGVAR